MSQCLWSDCRGNNAQATSNYSQVTCEKKMQTRVAHLHYPPTPPCYWKYICHNLKHQKLCFLKFNHKLAVPKKLAKLDLRPKIDFSKKTTKSCTSSSARASSPYVSLPFFNTWVIFAAKKKLKHLEDLDHPGWCGVKFIRRHNLSF